VRRRRPPLTDSAWFWVVVFSTMAMLALATISPKYVLRQERLERMAEGRRRAAEGYLHRQAEAAASASQVGAAEVHSDRGGSDTAETSRIRPPTVWPLAVVLCMLWLLGVWGLVRWRRTEPCHTG
jgi:hypothetical protein